MEHKSITKREVMGFSYKTAWDAVNAINNLLRAQRLSHAPRLAWRGAEVTEEGGALILAFRRLEKNSASISTAIAEEGLEHERDCSFWASA